MARIRIGATFPTTDIPGDPSAIRAYAQGLEALGYDYLLAWDHVLGADPSVRPDWRPVRGAPPVFTHKSKFHEPFALFGFLAGVTTRLRFATGILILPQRQTALVAKQAAEVDVLSGGRLRLGVATGWSDVEFEALGVDWKSRGPILTEQVELLRALWTREVVTFRGRYHTVTAAGINPLPVQRPIPIWFGGDAPPVLRRVATTGDGWFPSGAPDDPAIADAWRRIQRMAREAGRDPARIGLEGQVFLSRLGMDGCVKAALAWKALGATHVSFSTIWAGFQDVDSHLRAAEEFRKRMHRG